jgi:ectoine hydroxylase-related dioxygenase (phytanoyl-CoA dioxygenase family)
MKLSDQQVQFFSTFGFIKIPGSFADDIDRITEAYEQVWKDHGGGFDGRAHDYQRRSVLWPFIDDNDYLSSLIDDKRIKAIGTSLLGKGFNYASSDGNFYVSDTEWHSDTCRNFNYGPVMEDPSRSSHGYGALKLAFYLDPLTSENGCLRVIPGSHRVGDKFADSLQSEIFETEDKWGMIGKDVPAVPLETTPGDLLVFDLCTKHASFGGGTRRRMFTINLQQRFSDKDLPSLRENIASIANTKGGAHRFGALRAYGDIMIKTASPERMVHLEQRLANDSLLREKILELREFDESKDLDA